MKTIEERKKERFWNQLLSVIASGGVVPIVGEEMLQLPNAAPGETLYRRLASDYAAEYGIELEVAQQGSLSSTVRRHPDFFTKPLGICQEIAAQYADGDWPIPDSLRALAKVQHFNLFVSTTFDHLLERAINEERFGGKEWTQVVPFAPNNIPSDQMIEEAIGSGRPVIFQFFGNYRTPGQYALTEADMVEYIHAFEANQKKRIVTELYERTLLLLGNSFPDWLTRIILRLARNKPLDHGDQKAIYVADSQAAHDPSLRLFLKNFVTNTEIIDGMSTIEFVEEISKRWLAQFGSGNAATEIAPIVSTAPRTMPKNSVFISYCRSDSGGGGAEDTKAALAICEGLEKRGVDVWLDKNQLQGGDDYERKIKRYIDTSSVFIPLISVATDGREVSYFRKEWSWAIQRLPYFTGSQLQFIVPVLIGPDDWRPASVPKEFEPMHYVRMPTFQPDDAFLDHVKALYEQRRATAR